jgi:hypothetical protein
VAVIGNHVYGKYWDQTTSFVIFESASKIGAIARDAKSAIDPRYDLFLIRELDVQNAIICGKNADNDVYELMPYLKNI